MAGWRGAWHQLSSSSGDCDIKSELWGNTVLKIQTLMRFTFFLRSFLAAVCPLWIILTRWAKCESMWPFLVTLKLALSPWQPAQKLPQCPPRRQIPLTLLRLLPIWEALKKWKWVTSTPAVNLWLNWGYFNVAALMWCVCNPFKRTLEAAAESGVRGSDWKQEKKTMCWIRQTEVEHFLYVCVCVNDAWWCSPEYLNMLTFPKRTDQWNHHVHRNEQRLQQRLNYSCRVLVPSFLPSYTDEADGFSCNPTPLHHR